MFRKKHYMSTERVWFGYNFIEPGTPVTMWYGIRWAHFSMDGQRLGKILKSAAKQKFVKI